LIATKNHKVFTTKGKKPLHSLDYYDKVLVCEKWKKLYFKTLFIEDTLKRKSGHLGFTLHLLVLKGRKGDLDFIKKYGNLLMARYLAVIVFIIKTVIPPIMKSITSSVYLLGLTSLTIAKIGLAIMDSVRKIKTISTILGNCLTNGEKHQRARNGTPNTPTIPYVTKNHVNLLVLSVAKYLIRYSNVVESFVAKNVTVVSKQENLEPRDVYNLTVEEYEQEEIKQQWRCLLCKRAPDGKFHVDHDHVTGKYRGLLCPACNKALGMFQEDIPTLKRAIEYLEKHGPRNLHRD